MKLNTTKKIPNDLVFSPMWKNMFYIQNTLIKYLGKVVEVPPGGEEMILVEIYSNGNVACLPLNSDRYTLREYRARSIKLPGNHNNW